MRTQLERQSWMNSRNSTVLAQAPGWLAASASRLPLTAARR